MSVYGNDEHAGAVAYGCRYFKHQGFSGNRFDATGEDISCSTCSRWDGNQCTRNSFDSLLKKDY